MKYEVLNATQAETLTIFTEHYGVSLTELQSKEGQELDDTCLDLARSFGESLANNFVNEDTGNLARAFKALALGGSI